MRGFPRAQVGFGLGSTPGWADIVGAGFQPARQRRWSRLGISERVRDGRAWWGIPGHGFGCGSGSRQAR